MDLKDEQGSFQDIKLDISKHYFNRLHRTTLSNRRHFLVGGGTRNTQFWNIVDIICTHNPIDSFDFYRLAVATAQTRPSKVYLWQVWVVSRWGGETNSSQAATIVVVKQSLGSWSHLWSLSNVSGCGSTSLFGSRAGTHQIRDQSRPLEDRNDINNSLEVYTPNSFIHLFYNSPYMDIVDMHSVIVTPSDSVLWEKTIEASYLVGSFPCQFNFISVFDIPVWDEVWEQATSRHLCPFR